MEKTKWTNNKKVTVPIGVIGVIYESRPDVTPVMYRPYA